MTLEDKIINDVLRRLSEHTIGLNEAQIHMSKLIKEETVKARIDEMDVALAEVTHWSVDNSDSAIYGYGKHRIAKLKAELEEV